MLNREEITTMLLSERLSLTVFFATIVRSYHLAEDIFQELCVKCIVREEVFESKGHLLNWARRAGKNRAIDLLRSRKGVYIGLDEAVLETLSASWSEHEDGSRKERLDVLQGCLNKLSSSKREILRLRYFEGRSGTDVAEQLGRKLETVYQTLARIHKSLGECVKARLESIGRQPGVMI